MESHGGRKQLCKGISQALIQRKYSPESVLWHKWPGLTSGQKEVSCEMCPCTELDAAHLQ